MPIPPGTKFHGVAPGVETDNKGSKTRNVDRDTYAIEEFGGDGISSFRAIPTQPILDFSALVLINGVDAETGLPRVQRQTINASEKGSRIAGLLSPDAVRNEPSDVIVSGEVENVTFLTPTGGGAEVGDIIYGATSMFLAWGEGPFFDESVPVGRILTTPTLVQAFGAYDLYSATVFITIPDNTAYYADNVSVNDSVRLSYTREGSLSEFNIVKNTAGIKAERWDPAGGDTVDQIVGVITKEYTSDNPLYAVSVCMGGLMRIPYDAFVGADPTVGDLVYSDSTTPYLLTTASTSGFRIGFVTKLFFDNDDQTSYAVVKVEVARSGSGGGGGGNTTGEDLSLNVRTNPYSAAGDHEGTVLSIGTLGLTVGTVYMWNGTEWGDANAGTVGTADGLMGVATDSAVAPDVLVSGIIQLSSVPGSVGDPLYLDTSNGLLTATAPSGSTETVRVMGYKLDTNRVYFNPSQDWLEIV